MKFNEFPEIIKLVDDDSLLVLESSTQAVKRVKLLTLKKYIGVNASVDNISTDYLLWLKADKGIVLNGNTVSSWSDQSANNFSASQSLKASQPLLIASALNGLPALRFDGIDDHLFSDSGIGILDNRSIFIVVKINEYKLNTGIFSLRSSQYLDWNSTDGIAILQNQTNQSLRAVAGSSYQSSPGTNNLNLSIPIPLLTWSILRISLASGIGRIVKNIEPAISDAYQINHTRNTVGYVIGARGTDSDNSNGKLFSLYGASDIAEIIVYGKTLSNSEEESVISYLNAKYKIY